MKNRKSILNYSTLLFLLLSFFTMTLNAQKDKTHSYQDLEMMQDECMDCMKQVYDIAKNYPAFGYEYVMENGKLKKVEITGIDNTADKKKVEMAILDLNSKRNEIKNEQNRIGVFYSPDKSAKYKDGEDELRRMIAGNIEYPDNVKNYGTKGMVYVKFVVDEDGKIPFITANSDLENSMKPYTEALESNAVEAVKDTSGDWIPAKVEGVEVASLAVVPVHFDFRTHPSIPALIR